MSWQSILRGVGVYSGCTRCVDVCRSAATTRRSSGRSGPIAERTPEKEARLAEMARRRSRGTAVRHHARSARWIAGPIGR